MAQRSEVPVTDRTWLQLMYCALSRPCVQNSEGKGVKCWNSNSMRARGYVKEGLELTLMGPFDIEQGGVNSGPDSRGVLEWMWTDGPGFSLCAAPLESSGPGF